MSRLNAASSPLHLANTLLHLGRLDEALAAYDRALKIEPHNLEAIHNRGRTLLRLNRPADAVNCFQQVLKILPNHPTVLLDHGNALRALGEFAEALVSYGRALRFEPKNANAHNDRARALLDLNRPEEALAGCERALGINPHHAMALTNRALALMRLDRHEEALAAYLALQRLHPDSVAAHWGESLCCLLMGYLQRGFGKFSWRFRAHSYLAWKPGISVSFWEGEDIRGKTVLLICEQGYGDMLQFVRYATLVAQCGAEVIIIAPQALERLLWSVPGVARVVGDGEPIPRFHFACWMMDLPNLFRTRLDTSP